ncbi:Membrane protein (Modular protein) [Nitrospira tepida]|uniref:Membrane protein (Modular protein) n=1 Tax=Nitrospira tepida TaxID=2973512 RepID=A0AA86N1T1_9BACT|nr:hypothetical protein [Nitrospira tepida]CAI4033084.1 Membrane protein (Modular protein) [Nitrospira tepida]
MRLLLSLLIALAAWWPIDSFAEGAGGGYRGIAQMYYFLMWAILCYGAYDTFGKKVMYVAAPLLAIGLYMMLPAH